MSDDVSRRNVLFRLGVLVNGAAAALLAVPIVGYLLAPVRRVGGGGYRSWITLGSLSDFPEGETRLATFHNPSRRPWDGQTADIPCWVRHLEGENGQLMIFGGQLPTLADPHASMTDGRPAARRLWAAGRSTPCA